MNVFLSVTPLTLPMAYLAGGVSRVGDSSKNKKTSLVLPTIDVAKRPWGVSWGTDRLLGMCRVETGVRRERQAHVPGAQIPWLPRLPVSTEPKETRTHRTHIDLNVLTGGKVREKVKHKKKTVTLPKMNFNTNSSHHESEMWTPRIASSRSTKSTEKDRWTPKRVELPRLNLVQVEKAPQSNSPAHDPFPSHRGYHHRCYEETSDEDLEDSFTLPRIEEVLRSEGIQPHSINQQLDSIKNRSSV